MEFKQAMRVIKRICALRDGCEKCELKLNCPIITIPSELDYNKAESVLAKWAEEHTEKTRLDDFLDKHPKASLDDNDTPRVCAMHLGYCTECIAVSSTHECDNCWRRPLEEVE